MAHKTESGKSSRAPQALEGRVAELFRKFGFRRAERIIKEQHDSRPDVEVPELPDLAVDSKYTSRGFPQYTQFMAEVETYVGQRRKNEDRAYGWAMMPLRIKGSPDILVVLRLEKLLELLQKVFLRDKAGTWGCMRCGNEVEETGNFAGQYQYKCTTCGMCITTNETPDPKHLGRVSSQREKLRASNNKAERVIIKDTSTPVPLVETPPLGHKPLPGQLSASDLINRIKSPSPPTKKPKKSSRKEKP